MKARGTRVLVGLGTFCRHNLLFGWIEYKLRCSMCGNALEVVVIFNRGGSSLESVEG